MKFVLLLIAVIASSLAAPNSVVNLASENDIAFHFYCHRNPKGNILKFSQINVISLRDIFDPSLETIVLFHGWQDDYSAESNTEVRSEILRHFNVNIIKVDWGPIAGQLYSTAMQAVPGVGRFAAGMLRKISELYNYDVNKVTAIGFSLGAHAAGNMGAALNGQIAQIIGLDPAGPGISAANTDYSLDPTDAKFVTAIHTNTNLLGILEPVGHSDYYPNGGGSQPGCRGLLANSCSHNRAWAYLVESFATNRFAARQCSSYNEYTTGRCTGAASIMGGLPVDTRARRSYYLTTNSDAPFARG